RALLSAQLTPQERQGWSARLEDPPHAIEGTIHEGWFGAAEEAARTGWDDPALHRILRGEATASAWAGAEEPPYYAEELTAARLSVLECQGRTEEYLRLAAAEDEVERYAVMLARLGRIEEAVEYGLARLGKRGELLALGKALRQAGADEAALRVAE